MTEIKPRRGLRPLPGNYESRSAMAEMIKVEFVENVMNKGRCYQAGEIVSLPESTANLYKQKGWVVFLKDKLARLQAELEKPDEIEDAEDEPIKMVEETKPIEMVGPNTVHKPIPLKAKRPVKKATKRGR